MLTLHCGPKDPAEDSNAEAAQMKQATPPADLDAAPVEQLPPTAKQARGVLEAFATALEASALAQAKELLWIPKSVEPDDLDGFLRRLTANGHISTQDSKRWANFPFGRADVVLGDQATELCLQHGVDSQRSYVLGDRVSLALFFQSESGDLKIVALKNLAGGAK